nr:MAG TPA: hypothetical protein [Caudoviricetes sp.]
MIIFRHSFFYAYPRRLLLLPFSTGFKALYYRSD